MTDISVWINDGSNTLPFREVEIGKCFVYRDKLFVKTEDGSGEIAYSDDPTSAIELQSGEEWVFDSGEVVTIPKRINIDVEVV